MSERINELENAMEIDEMQDLDLTAIKEMINRTGTDLRTYTNTDNIKIHKDGCFMFLPRTLVGGNYNVDRFAEYLEAEVKQGARVYFFEPGSAAPTEMKSSENGTLSFEAPDLSPEAPAVTKPSGWKRFANWITRGSAYKADFDAYAQQQKAAQKWEEDSIARTASGVRRQEMEGAGVAPVVNARANTVPAVQTRRMEMNAEQLREEARRQEERRRRDEANRDKTIDNDGNEVYTSKKENEFGGRVQARVISASEQQPVRPSAQRSDPEKGGKGMQ